MHKLGDIGQGQHRAEEREQGQHWLTGLHKGVVDDPLGAEAGRRRHTDDGKSGDKEHQHGKGHLAAEAAEIPQVVLGGHEHDGAADEEEQILEEDVVNQVEEAAGETEAGVTALGRKHQRQRQEPCSLSD